MLEIPVGLPSELVQRRPDVLQAERRLAAQTARIGVVEVLDLQRSQFSAELAASQALQLHLSSIVELYKALGGGWTPTEQLAAAGIDAD